ncbi:flagellar basal body L-ring protein FlgH [bacterium]|jgi:flagellar basal body L-ring protein FlgH|nr:flagellar basal body L-ring protein FlgH [bacterium]
MKARYFSLIALCLLSVGCSSIMGGLRRDLRDIDEREPFHDPGPTFGGVWSERGLLADDEMSRAPASDSNRSNSRQNGSWISPEQEEANRRDMYRNSIDPLTGRSADVAYSNSPSVEPAVKRNYRPNRTTKNDFIDNSQTEGSLWASDGQTNYYFVKNKTRGGGDIVTVTLEPNIMQDVQAELMRTLTPEEKMYEMKLAQAKVRARYFGLPEPNSLSATDMIASNAAAPQRNPAAAVNPANSPAAPSPNPANPAGGPAPAAAAAPTQAQATAANAMKITEEEEEKVPRATPADVDISKAYELKAGETIMTEIIDRYPNGNYKLRGTKRIKFRNGYKYLNLVGIAKSTDVTPEDTIPSTKLYEYRLEVVE